MLLGFVKGDSSQRPAFADDHFMAAEGLYLVGDGAGTSRGITAAWASGLWLMWEAGFLRAGWPGLLLGGLVFLAVALPWYVAVSIDTNYAFIRDFLSKHLEYWEVFVGGAFVLIVLFTSVFATISIIEDRRESPTPTTIVSAIESGLRIVDMVLAASPSLTTRVKSARASAECATRGSAGCVAPPTWLTITPARHRTAFEPMT